MIKEFQNLREQILKIAKENLQMKKELAQERKKSSKDKKHLLLSIVEQLDLIEKEIITETENNNQFDALKEKKKRKAPLLAILSHNEVVEMDDFMYKLPQYVEQKNGLNASLKINLKGYLWKGEILRKAVFFEDEN